MAAPFSQIQPYIIQSESGGKNIMQNLVSPSVSTASGYYQITNSTWRGVPSNITQGYPTAMSAPFSVQTQAAQYLWNTNNGSDWLGNGTTYLGNPQIIAANNALENGGTPSFSPSQQVNDLIGGSDVPGSTDSVGNINNAVSNTDPINSFTSDTTGQAASADTGIQTADTSNAGGGLIGDAMSILSGIASGGAGAGVTYNANQAAANNEANATGKSLGILGAPDVAKAITSAGNAVTSGFNAVGETLGTKVSQTIADAEAYAGRGLVMIFAVVVFAIGAFFLMPKGSRETIVATAARAAS